MTRDSNGARGSPTTPWGRRLVQWGNSRRCTGEIPGGGRGAAHGAPLVGVGRRRRGGERSFTGRSQELTESGAPWMGKGLVFTPIAIGLK